MRLTIERRKGIKLLVAECDKNADKAFYRTSSELLKELLANMASLALKYTEYVHVQGDAPYIYHERQLDGLIAPALSKICDGAILTECPISRVYNLRGYDASEGFGRFDYWCMYSRPSRNKLKKSTFIIEVKHNYDNFTTDETRKELIDNWRVMCDYQLTSVRDDAKNFIEPTKGVIRIGLLFVTSECRLPKGKQIKDLMSQYEKKLPEVLERLQKDVITCKPKKMTANFVACWLPPQKHIEQVAKDTEIYPGLIMMGKIHEPIAHKGSRK